MAYLGRNPAIGTQKVLDSLESQFNGVLTTFNLRYTSNVVYPTLPSSLIVSLGGVLQEPGTAYTVASDQIVFASAPGAGTDCWILLYSEFGAQAGATPSLIVANDATIGGELHGPANFIIDPAVIGANTGTVEIKGNLTVQGTQTTINSTTVDLDHLALGDNEKFTLGAGGVGDNGGVVEPDLEIYSNGTNIYFDSGFIASSASPNIYFRTSSSTTLDTNALTILNSGQVGIGTDDPRYSLDVHGGNLLVSGSAAGNLILEDRSVADGSRPFAVLASNDGNFTITNSNRNASGTTTGSIERLRITSTGKLEAYKGTSTTGKTSGSEAFTVGNGAGNHRFAVYPDGTTVIGGTGLIGNYNILLQNDGQAVFNSNIQVADSILHVGDTNTKIRFPALDTFTVETGGNERFRIISDGGTTASNNVILDENGNMGIGTNSPSDDLSILASPNSLVIGCKDSTRTNHIFQLLADDPAGNGELRLYKNSATGTHEKAVEIAASGNSYINSGGNLGIGTNNPGSRLDVNGLTKSGGFQANGNVTPTAGHGVEIFAPSSSQGMIQAFNRTGSSQMELKFRGSDITFFGTSSTDERVRITGAGNVGIGTNNPGSKLEIKGSGGGTGLTFRSTDSSGNTNFWIMDGGKVGVHYSPLVINQDYNDTATPSSTYFYVHGSSPFIVKSDGKVGIGTNAPDLKLHVSGTNGLPAISGSTPVGHISVRAKGTSSSHGFHMGVSNAVPWSSWIQAQDASNLATNYPLLLNPNGGNVGIGTATPGYKLEVNGSFAATTKSFVIPHPTKEGMKLRHGSLEGPENGVYVRGRSCLEVINLPDYWTALVDPDSITVVLTPIGPSGPPRVERIENNKVYVFSEDSRPLDYFYMVNAERVDVEPLEVEIPE